MAAKIGILGEDTGVAHDTLVTVYTVPANKAARIRVYFAVELQNAGVYTVTIGQPSNEITITKNLVSAGEDCWTGSSQKATPDPALSILGQDMGVQSLVSAFVLNDPSALFTSLIAPLAIDYFLSTGDTVKYKFDGINVLRGHVFQVVGVEDDA